MQFRVNHFPFYNPEILLHCSEITHHPLTRNALRVAADRSVRCADEIDKKFRSRYIARLTGSGSFLALLISSTLRGFLIVHAARSPIGPYLAVSLYPGSGPGGGLRVDGGTRARAAN